ncbi:TonB-dependent receptor domain-containing protein [Algicola sagamiensis]|uniref:TonB-dependent receptor domain-containing protein n=1 Tax=Algicola sagamiensis TaxID=163869 RepID=UPI0003642894|nr:TonB-dependent receptor [Algicola sagamiensis]
MIRTKNAVNAVRLALTFGAASTAALTPVTHAAEEDVERIEVTGSRIKQTDIEGANPVTVIGQDLIKSSGITDIGDLIQSLPAMSGSPIGTTTNNGGNGGVFVSLRGMDEKRTLILIDGKRVVTNDFQTIPAAMIKRVEILKDGASAIYGADAVAGVVNIITRKDFEGVELTYQHNNALEADEGGNQHTYSAVFGRAWDNGYTNFGAEYVEQEEVFNRDLPWKILQAPFWMKDYAKYRQFGFVEGVSVTRGGSSRIPNGNFVVEGMDGSQTLDDDGNIIPLASDNRYNYQPVNYMQTPYEKLNLWVNSGFDINDEIRFKTMIRHSNRKSEQLLAPTPFTTPSDPGYKITITNPDGTTSVVDGISKDNFYNPFRVNGKRANVLSVNRRIVEDERRYIQNSSMTQAVATLEGEINDSWSWEFFYNKAYRTEHSKDFGQFSGERLANAMGPSFQDDKGNILCGTPDKVIKGCVPINMFGAGNISQEMLKYVKATLVDVYEDEMDHFSGTIMGELHDIMPAGSIGVAFGYEYRKEERAVYYDSGKQHGTVTGTKATNGVGGYKVNSLMTEIAIPLLDQDDMRFDANLGLRYDDFNTFGSNVSHQLGLKFQPMDGLLLRATLGEVFRAPNVDELVGTVVSNPTATDPCNASEIQKDSTIRKDICIAQGVPFDHEQANRQLTETWAGNINLDPEEGDTLTIGAAWSPDFLEGLSVTLDYWQIELEKAIARRQAPAILDKCYKEGDQSFCDLIKRDPFGEVIDIDNKMDNLGEINVKGVDLELKYAFETSVGEWKTSLSWTHLLKREQRNEPGSKIVEVTGGYYNSYGDESYIQDKAILGFGWFYEDLTINYKIEYLSGLDAVDGEPEDKDFFTIGSFVYHDISADYSFQTGTTASFGLTNLFNKEPPYNPLNTNDTDSSAYRVLGRSMFFRVTQKF